MAISASANINFTYGNYSQDESFTADVTGRDYIAGSGRATENSTAITAGSYVGTAVHGLLLITNENTVGDLLVSIDGGSNWDISIPATMSNLISVNNDHAVYVKVAQASVNGTGIASASSTAVTFDNPQASGVLGTATVALAGGSYGSGGPWLYRFTSSTVATPYDSSGETIQDLSSNYSGTTTVDVDWICDYHYVLTEK